MTELPAKFEPEAVRVKSGPPLATVAGLMLERVGAGGGAVTLSESGLEAQRPPTQAAGLLTCTATLPCPATSPASTAMESCVGEIRVTVRGWPPTVAVAPGTKPVPVTVRAKAGVPAATLAGARLARLGVGLILATVMVGLAGREWRKVYGEYEGLAAPTAARESQLLGVLGGLLRVAVMVAPGGAVVVLTARQGPVTVRGSAFEVPPPGAGVKAVMLRVPPAATSPARMVAESWLGPTKVVVRFT